MPFVYFIGDDHQRVKVGWAMDPCERLKMFQVGNADQLKLLHTIEYPSKQRARHFESMLHSMFIHIRIIGEWFDINGLLYADAPEHGTLGQWIERMRKKECKV